MIKKNPAGKPDWEVLRGYATDRGTRSLSGGVGGSTVIGKVTTLNAVVVYEGQTVLNDGEVVHI